MIISKRTINLWTDFAKVNPSILIKKNDKLRTMSNMKNILAVADCEERFPFDMPIYHLKEFANVLKTYAYPEILQDDRKDTVVIREFNNDTHLTRYKLADKEMITTIDEEKLKDVKSRFDDSRRITIKITAFDFARIIKVIKTIDANLLSIAIQSGKGTLSVANGTNSWDRSERTYFNLQFDAPPNIELLTHIKAESIEKLPVGDYEISISDKFLAKFDCMKNKTPTQTDLFMNSLPFTTDATIEYLIAVENEFLFSEYGKNNKVLKSSETRN